jgi:hypothetical protein
MQSLFDDVLREIPSADDYETNCRDVWPQRWALLKAKVEKFTSTNSAMVPCCYFNLPKLACNLFPNRKCGAKACLLKAQHQ